VPTIEALEDFTNGMSGGGAPFNSVGGTPVADTSVRHAFDPASLLIEATSASEYVEHLVSAPTRGWNGFWFRMDAADEPSVDVTVCVFNPAAGNQGYLAYTPGSNSLYWYTPGSGTPSAVISLDAWHWVEMIFDVSGTTRTVDVRIDGVTGTQASVGGASASTVTSISLGDTGATTKKYRCSYWNRGSASSTSDWSGELSAAGSSIVFAHRVGW
jgi:hypothetical protein